MLVEVLIKHVSEIRVRVTVPVRHTVMGIVSKRTRGERKELMFFLIYKIKCQPALSADNQNFQELEKKRYKKNCGE